MAVSFIGGGNWNTQRMLVSTVSNQMSYISSVESTKYIWRVSWDFDNGFIRKHKSQFPPLDTSINVLVYIWDVIKGHICSYSVWQTIYTVQKTGLKEMHSNEEYLALCPMSFMNYIQLLCFRYKTISKRYLKKRKFIIKFWKWKSSCLCSIIKLESN